MYSLDIPGIVRVKYLSVWQDWHTLEDHRRSAWAEEKVFEHFGNIQPENLEMHIYEEVGSRQ